MRQFRKYGSVRGVSGNRRSYRDHILYHDVFRLNRFPQGPGSRGQVLPFALVKKSPRWASKPNASPAHIAPNWFVVKEKDLPPYPLRG